MTDTYESILQKIADKFIKEGIAEKDINFFKNTFNKKRVKCLLEQILSNKVLLKKIADRSYSHALGFDKIVLMDLSKDIEGCDVKTQLRLHLWDAQNDAVPMVESMHEHSFDFISTVLSGKLENQIFEVNNMGKEEEKVLVKIKNVLKVLSEEDKYFLNQQIEIIEAVNLQKIGSNQLEELKLLDNYQESKLLTMTNMSFEEIKLLTSIQGHYISDRVRGQKKAYKHVFNKYLKITPHCVSHIEQGEYYFHPYQYPHRLYYDNTEFNSTILITTPVKSNDQGGSLQRPTYIIGKEKAYDKKSILENELRLKLEKYVELISKGA